MRQKPARSSLEGPFGVFGRHRDLPSTVNRLPDPSRATLVRRLSFWTLRRRSLCQACSEFIDHYHAERAHQGLGNVRVVRGADMGTGDVECTERLGGILKHYRRAA